MMMDDVISYGIKNWDKLQDYQKLAVALYLASVLFVDGYRLTYRKS